MKKRLISMLMAVLMIASLLPTVVFAADDAADNCALGKHEYTTVKIQKDTEKKTPGVEVKVCKHCNYIDENSISIKAFALLWNQCKNCEKGKTMTVITASCRNEGLTISYCEKCGKAFDNKDYGNKSYKIEDALTHVYSEFKVVEAPKCTTPGYGYAVCKLCGDPAFVADADEAARLVKRADFSNNTAYASRVREVYNMFAPTNPDHDKLNLLVAVTEETKAKGVDGTEVILKPAQAAVHYATVNGQQYKHADKTAQYETVEAPDFEAGYTGDKYCPDCGVGVQCGEPIAHTYVNSKDGEFPAYNNQTKIWEKGSADTIKCDTCRYKGGAEIKHLTQWYDESSAIAATCETVGKDADLYWIDSDNVIKHTTGSATKKLGHNFVLAEGKKATCLEPGFEYVNYKVCTRDGCNKTEGNINRTITLSAPGKHDYQLVAFEGTEATCQHKGLSYKECKVCHEKFYVAGELYTETTDMVAHTAADERANVKEATCLEKGYTGDKVCKFCGYVMEAGTETKLGDHTPEAVEAKAPTCTEPGVSKGTVCKVCGKVLDGQKTEPALGHKTELQNAKAATCTEAGYSGDEVCTVCKVTVEKGKTIPKLGHETVLQNAKDATCTEKGYTGDKYCTLCKTVVEQGSETKALEHNYVSGICSRCDAKQPGYMPFTDVKTGEYYYNAVMWAYTNDVAKGTTKTTFGVNDGCTRAQIVTFLWRAAGSPAPKTTVNPFTDIVKGDYYDAILWAVENGITKGTSATTFDPNSPCTRGQIVTFLWRYEKSPVVSTVASFKDVPTTEYYYKAVNWAVANGITDGTGNGMFSPDATCTRAQAVTFLWRDFVK